MTASKELASAAAARAATKRQESETAKMLAEIVVMDAEVVNHERRGARQGEKKSSRGGTIKAKCPSDSGISRMMQLDLD